MEIVLKAAEVAARLSEYLIIDARSREEYEKAHIAGAVFLPGNQHLKSGDVMMSQGEFEALMCSIGAENSSKILVYDDGNGRNPARFWFVAKHYGHDNVFVLDGGWPAIGGLPQSTDLPQIVQSNYVAGFADGFIATVHSIVENYGKIKLLDVRTADEYAGRNLMDNPRGGHIPGAINVDFNEFLSPDTDKYFVPHDNINFMMTSAGISKDDFIVPY